MSVFLMVPAGTPDASPSERYPDVWLQECHKGMVVAVFERNGYDDSDFIATVWDPAQAKTVDVVFASTAFWSYPAYATVDASCEVHRAAAAYSQSKVEELRRITEANAAKQIGPGKLVTVRVVRGKKKAFDGLNGRVFWVGPNKFKWGTSNAGVVFNEGTPTEAKEFFPFDNLTVVPPKE